MAKAKITASKEKTKKKTDYSGAAMRQEKGGEKQLMNEFGDWRGKKMGVELFSCFLFRVRSIHYGFHRGENENGDAECVQVKWECLPQSYSHFFPFFSMLLRSAESNAMTSFSRLTGKGVE